MSDLLDTINHTTLEALGFKNISALGSASDVFAYNSIRVIFYSADRFTVSRNGSVLQVGCLKDLKQLIGY